MQSRTWSCCSTISSVASLLFEKNRSWRPQIMLLRRKIACGAQELFEEFLPRGAVSEWVGIPTCSWRCCEQSCHRAPEFLRYAHIVLAGAAVV